MLCHIQNTRDFYNKYTGDQYNNKYTGDQSKTNIPHTGLPPENETLLTTIRNSFSSIYIHGFLQLVVLFLVCNPVFETDPN